MDRWAWQRFSFIFAGTAADHSCIPVETVVHTGSVNLQESPNSVVWIWFVKVMHMLHWYWISFFLSAPLKLSYLKGKWKLKRWRLSCLSTGEVLCKRDSFQYSNLQANLLQLQDEYILFLDSGQNLQVDLPRIQEYRGQGSKQQPLCPCSHRLIVWGYIGLQRCADKCNHKWSEQDFAQISYWLLITFEDHYKLRLCSWWCEMMCSHPLTE